MLGYSIYAIIGDSISLVLITLPPVVRDASSRSHFQRSLAFEPESKLLDQVEIKRSEGNFTAARILEERAEAVGAGRKGYIGMGY